MHAAADVGDVLEPGADAGRAVQQRQRRACAGGGGRCRSRSRTCPAAAGAASPSSASGVASMPPGTPKTRLIRSGGGRMPSSSQRTALTTWPTSKASTSSAMPALGRALDDPAAGRRRRDERLVAEVHRARLDAGDVRASPRGRWCAPRSSCRWRRRSRPSSAGREPARMRSITSTNSSGRPLGRAVVLAHVQVHDGGAGRGRLDRSSRRSPAVVYGMFGLFSRKTSAPVTATVTTTGLLFQALIADLSGAASDARSSSVIGREPAPLGVPEHEAELRLDHHLAVVVEDALAGRHARAPELAHPALARSPVLERRVDLAPEARPSSARRRTRRGGSRGPPARRRAPPRDRSARRCG